MFINKFFLKFLLISLFSFVLFFASSVLYAQYEPFGLYTNDSGASGGGIAFNFFPSGYSDGFWWGETIRHHGHGSHEMLSGEFAAALAWSQSGSNQAIWLERNFVEPDLTTNSSFQPYGNPSYLAWNNPNNSASDSCDTAYSVIRNIQNTIEVRIDYELVDLGQQDANGVGGSPIAFTDANGTTAYCFSDPCVILITYSVKNLTTSNITGLEFYQMLCGLSSYIYYSSYTSENYCDPLSNYSPKNSVHQVGNFRYDISQWGYGDPNDDHVDWMSVSSSIPPVSYDTGYYPYNNPTSGTYARILNKALNNETFANGGQVAGAMQFNLGNLTPNETKKITLAVMFGSGPIQRETVDVNLTKTDDVNDCVFPSTQKSESFFNYTVNFIAHQDVNSVLLVDSLPEYVDFNSCTGGGIWSEPNHTVTWNLGDLNVNDSNTFTLRVKVMPDAPQNESIQNYIRMYSDSTLVKTEHADTNICCLEPAIYVDKDATGLNSGLNWENAYTDLQTALAAVRNNQHICCSQIWVADGDYTPTTNPNDHAATFQMIPHIAMYGNFEGWETNLSQRNLADGNYASVLSGDVDNNGSIDITSLVTAAEGSRLDGFTIRKSGTNYGGPYSGIYCNNVSNIIANCLFKENAFYPIRCYAPDVSSTVSIFNCKIENNLYGAAIFCQTFNVQYPAVLKVIIDKCTIANNGDTSMTKGIASEGNTDLQITNSTISGNTGDAISTSGKKLTVQNCDIIDNDGPGIYANWHILQVIAKNNYIHSNNGKGLYITDSPQSDIAYNIISDNNDVGIDVSGIAKVTNNYVNHNGLTLHNGGIALHNNSELRNNTIVSNHGKGINSNSAQLAITNNIIRDNTDGAFNNTSLTNVTYNCLPNGSYTNPAFHNIYSDPCFVSADDYHLKKQSNCINAGNPNFTTSSETDIDGEDRCLAPGPVPGDGSIKRLDMGCDEFNPFDLSLDHVTDFFDFTIFAEPWQKTNLNPAEDLCNFYNDNTINYKDLRLFCEYWLMAADWPGIGGDGAIFEPGNGDDFAKYDLQKNGIIDFNDFTILARTWQLKKINNGFLPRCDFMNDNKIDYKDLELFSAHWLNLTNDFVPRITNNIIEITQPIIDTNEYVADEPTLEQLTEIRDWLLEVQSQGEDVNDLLTIIDEQIAALTPPDINEPNFPFDPNMFDPNNFDPNLFEMNNSLSRSFMLNENENSIPDLTNWLDDLWQNDAEFRNSMTEQQYLDFRQSLEQPE
jgi:hypothetical protein